MAKFDVRDDALLGARGVAEHNTVMREHTLRPWQQLATELLPTPLRTELLKLKTEDQRGCPANN
ncbi:MAG: hypothetical protein ACRDRU_14250 [Pseudonocardiaceae bacterium]